MWFLIIGSPRSTENDQLKSTTSYYEEKNNYYGYVIIYYRLFGFFIVVGFLISHCIHNPINRALPCIN